MVPLSLYYNLQGWTGSHAGQKSLCALLLNPTYYWAGGIFCGQRFCVHCFEIYTLSLFYPLSPLEFKFHNKTSTNLWPNK